MLAHHPRRQHPSPPANLNLDPNQPSASSTTKEAYSNYPSQPVGIPYDPSIASNFGPTATVALRSHSHPSADYYMPASNSYNPSIRAQQPLPSSGGAQYPAHRHRSLDNGGVSQSAWYQFHSGVQQAAHQAPHAEHQRLRFEDHQDLQRRHSSNSSVTSAGPDSPFTPNTAYPRIADNDSHSYNSPNLDTFDNFPTSAPSYTTKSLPNSTIAAFTDSLIAPSYDNFYQAQDANTSLAFQAAMKEAIMSQQHSGMGAGESLQEVDHSYNGEFDPRYRISAESRNLIPKLDRTMSDIYQDELYNPNLTHAVTSQPISSTVQTNLLSPRRDVFSERLQAANNEHMSARSISPTTTASRDRSPFQPNSPWRQDEFSQLESPSRLNSAAQIREQQKAVSDAMALAQHSHSAGNNMQPPQTISPKEAFLDYEDNVNSSNMVLFPHSIKQEVVNNDQPIALSQQSFHSMATTRRESSSNYSNASARSYSQSNAPQQTRAVPQMPQQYPFISQTRRQNSGNQSGGESAPEFPAHITSMESTNSDTGSKSSRSQESDNSSDIKRPAHTAADSGTYSCTYHGCTQRFETPAKLQKHKRDGHRQITPQNAAGLSSSSAAAIANRNSQAGPHNCERINPSTGKPCNSVFSRPYDLTRHEATIHNSRKQKVRCHICTEEKSFSRPDALTRHMRVVHPEVDFPGKTKRRGGN